MIPLLPRLPGPAAEIYLQRFLEEHAKGWSGFNPYELPQPIRYGETGGVPISTIQLKEIRNCIECLAKDHGFDKMSSRADLAHFDAEVAAWISQDPLFDSGEALRDDTWSFIGVVLAPDIVHWRFGTSPERYIGGVRNTFQRLWIRGRALDRGKDHPKRWQLIEELTEDALVQITERPSIGGDPVLARAIAEAWLRAANRYGKAAMEPTMRQAVLRIRIKNELRSLSAISAEELELFLDEAYETSYRNLNADQSKVRTQEPDDQNATNTHSPTGVIVTIEKAVEKIRAEVERRGWLPPKS